MFNRIILLFIVYLGSFVFCGSMIGQTKPETKPSKVATTKNSNDNLRWVLLLDNLIYETRSISPESRRAYAIADIATAYWKFDRNISQTLFISALDSALPSDPEEAKKRDYKKALEYVLSSVAKVDNALTEKLIAKVVEKQKSNEQSGNSSISTALELLKHNPRKAAELAEAIAPRGLSDGSAVYFILELAKQDVALSNRVYQTYLNKFVANRNATLNQLLWLGGYPFGRNEGYSLDESNLAEITGFQFPQTAELNANPVLANIFLNTALRFIQRDIEQSSQAIGARAETLKITAFFATNYLFPEVVKYQPNAGEIWEQLRQQSTAGLSPLQHQQVLKNLQSINDARARTERYNNNPNNSDEIVELEEVEKIVGTCQRDREYSKIALNIGAKDFKKALLVTDYIKDITQQGNVKQYLYYDITLAAIKTGDFIETRKSVERISQSDLQAVLYVEMAEAAFKQQDRISGLNFSNEVRKLVEKISEQEKKEGLLLAMASTLIKHDLNESREFTTEAIKSINRQSSKDEKRFSILRKVSLGCTEGDDTWFGSSVSLNHSNLFDALVFLSTYDIEEMLLIAQNLNDRTIKIRSIARIVKSITDKNREDKPQKKV